MASYPERVTDQQRPRCSLARVADPRTVTQPLLESMLHNVAALQARPKAWECVLAVQTLQVLGKYISVQP